LSGKVGFPSGPTRRRRRKPPTSKNHDEDEDDDDDVVSQEELHSNFSPVLCPKKNFTAFLLRVL
jgi:hypothetical protein